MPYRRWIRPRARFSAPRLSKKGRIGLKLIILTVLISALMLPAWAYLRSLSGEIALSDATDLITLTINDAINRKMSDGEYNYSYFVTLEKDSSGAVSAITTNMARINTLSSELIRDIVDAGDDGTLNIRIPLGNLTGFNMLVGKGPEIPVDIIMLTSSHADFRNDFTSVGINQSRHQIVLELIVDIDVLIPWQTLSTQVVSEVMIAETIIVGTVPETYFNAE